MRKLLSSAAVIALSALLVASLANAQPGIGISKTSPLIGTGSSGSPLRIGPAVACSSGEILKWNGSAWACAADSSGSLSDGDKGDITVSSSGTVWNIDANTVTGTELNLIATNCGVGQFMTDIDSDGNGTCAAETGDISSVVAGTGLTGGATSGAATLDVACVSNSLVCNANDIGLASRDFGDITTSSSGTVMTIDNSAVTSAKLNITTTSCSAGQGVTAISAGGVGTCSALGPTGLTTGTIPVATSSTAIGNSTITDSGSVVTVGSRSLQVGVSLDVDGVYSGFGSTDYAYYIDATSSRPGTACLYGTNATGTCYMNAVGYQAGTTQFRDLKVQDGKGADIISVVGSTKAVTFAGAVTATGIATLSGGGDVSTALRVLAGSLFTTTGNVRDIGTTPTISSCNSGTASGGAWAFTLTPGSGTACTATFATSCSSAPTCSVTPGYSPTSVVPYITSVSSSALVLGATGTGWSGSQTVHVICVCH